MLGLQLSKAKAETGDHLEAGGMIEVVVEAYSVLAFYPNTKDFK